MTEACAGTPTWDKVGRNRFPEGSRMRVVLTLLPWFAALSLSTTPSAPAGACDPPARSSLAVPVHGQEESEWCWAACAEMVRDYFGRDVRQCDLATAQLGGGVTCPCDSCTNSAA